MLISFGLLLLQRPIYLTLPADDTHRSTQTLSESRHAPPRGLACASSWPTDSGLPSQWGPLMQPGILRKASKSYLILPGQQAQNLPASWKTGAALW